MKLTYAVLKLLPAATQAAFTKVNDSDPDKDDATEYDNGEEDAGGLKTALEKEKKTAAERGKKLAEFETAKAKEIEDAKAKALAEAREKGDFKAIEDDYKQRIKALEDGQKAAAKEAEKRLKQDAINKEAAELAKLFIAPDFALPGIKDRLAVDIVDGEAIVRVKTKDGKASGMSVADLRKELLTNPDHKRLLATSKADGGGSTSTKPPGGGSTEGKDDDKPLDFAKADPKDVVAALDAKRKAAGLPTGPDDGDDD